MKFFFFSNIFGNSNITKTVTNLYWNVSISVSLYIYTHLQIYTTSVYILALSQKCYNNIVYFWQYKLSRGRVRPTVHGMSLSASEWLLVLHSLWQPGNGAKPHFGRDRKFCHWVGGVFWSSRYHSTKCATILKKNIFLMTALLTTHRFYRVQECSKLASAMRYHWVNWSPFGYLSL